MHKQLKPLRFGVGLLITVILTLGFSLSLQSLLAAWTAPSANPPTNNIADLNLGGGLSVATNALVMGNLSTIGKVVIGTTSPTSQLHLYKNSNAENAEIAIQSGNGATIQNKWSIYQDGFGGGLRFWNDNVPGDKNALTILNNGNIGVGNIVPTEKLEVSGNGKFSGVLSSGKMQIIDVVTEGSACTSNGLIARDTNGLMLSCQSSNWKKVGETNLATTLAEYTKVKDYLGYSFSRTYSHQYTSPSCGNGGKCVDLSATVTWRIGNNGHVYSSFSGTHTEAWVSQTPSVKTENINIPETDISIIADGTTILNLGYHSTVSSPFTATYYYGCGVRNLGIASTDLPYIKCGRTTINGSSGDLVGNVRGIVDWYMLTLSYPKISSSGNWGTPVTDTIKNIFPGSF